MRRLNRARSTAADHRVDVDGPVGNNGRSEKRWWLPDQLAGWKHSPINNVLTFANHMAHRETGR